MPAEVKYLLFLIIPAIQDVLIILLVIRGFRLKRKREEDIESFRVKGLISLTPSLLICGALCGAVLSIPLTLFGPEQMSAGVWYLFEAAVLACLAMLLAFCNETITYDRESFEVSNLFGRKRSYAYEEITGIEFKDDVILHVGGRRIRVDNMAAGRSAFLDCAQEAYCRWNDNGIPTIESTKDITRGNLNAPWLPVALFILLVGGSAFFSVIAVRDLKPADDRLPEDAVEISTVFSSFEYDDGLQLYSESHEKPFTLSYLKGYEVSLPDPASLCSGETFVVMVQEYKSNYKICSIETTEHQVIISAFDVNTAYRNTSFVWCIVILVFSLIAAVYAVFAVLVARWPERYPKKVREKFYQDIAWTPLGKRRISQSKYRE